MNSLIQQKPRALVSRAIYMKRYAAIALPYLTPLKLANLFLNAFELRRSKTRPRSIPPFMKLEATPLCQMSCTACWHNSKEYKKTLNNKMHLTVERAARIVDPIVDKIIGVSLSFAGEPLLNRELPQVIEYLHNHGICTSFPTNLAMTMTSREAERLVRSGLDQLIVSLDGASQDTYLKYRVGGNFSNVLNNVRLLADIKKRLRRRRPALIWKMVVFPHNVHELATVRRKWRSLGFDGFEFVLDHQSPASKAIRTKANKDMVAAHRPCFWAWNTTVVGWDGSIEPCCQQINEIRLGNAAEEDIRAIWRSEAYVRLRAGFARDAYGEDMHPVCRRCIGLPEKTAEAERTGPIAQSELPVRKVTVLRLPESPSVE